MHSRLSFSRTSLAGGLVAAAWFATGHAAQAASFQTIYNFQGRSDGFTPYSGLIYDNGVFYGTTRSGGANGGGTVFSIVGDTEKVIYSFGKPHNGSQPEASLIDVGGLLYGTTEEGGENNNGTVFEVDPAGGEKVLHRFHSVGANGDRPVSNLLYRNGRFFGTTVGYNSGYSDGSVFSMAPSGKVRVLVSLNGYLTGAYPMAGLTDIKGRLYGTTSAGGNGTNCNGGCGTVFELLPRGGYRVIYNFKGGSDGAAPLSNVVGIDGTIYGATSGGGTGQCHEGNSIVGCGTVFKITPDGTETVLYNFTGGSDGFFAASLTAHGHVLYGTTEEGGAGYSVCDEGCGTVFKITEQGVETVLHAFNGTDGKSPAPGASLLYESGALYGTASSGGPNEYGTVFRIDP